MLLESAGLRGDGVRQRRGVPGRLYNPDQPGCLILDVRLPGMSGVALQEELERARHHAAGDHRDTGFADVDTAVRVLKRGAFDFFEKPLRGEQLLERVRAGDRLRRAAVGRSAPNASGLAARMARLTARERAVFDQVVQGKANKVVAIEFGISEKTVEAHRARVMHKLGATSLAELVRMDLAAASSTALRGLLAA